jgi:hypothetical protein
MLFAGFASVAPVAIDVSAGVVEGADGRVLQQ